MAGDDQQMLIPLEGIAKAVLNGKKSTDDKKVVGYLWEQIRFV